MSTSFIKRTFFLGQLARTDDANPRTLVGVGDDEQLPRGSHANRQKPRFFAGVVGIVKRVGKRITKDGRSISERYAVPFGRCCQLYPGPTQTSPKKSSTSRHGVKSYLGG